MQIADKIILVTGGASGIGRALCERFAKERAKGICVVDRDEDSGQRVAAAIGGMFVACDVGDEAQLQHAISETQQRLGPIDLFCGNAGMAFRDGPGSVAGSNNAQWTKIWEVNVMAHVYAARALLPQMIERGSGYFLITASAAGLLTQIGSSAYSVTKHGAVAFAESLAIAHGEQGIGVSLLCPQGVWTNMTRWVKESRNEPRREDAMLEPEQVAETVVQGLAEERFLILTHPITQDYIQHKAGDYDAWLRRMQRYRGKLREQAKARTRS